MSKQRLMNIREAADYIGVVPGTLYQWRNRRAQHRPKEIQVGRNLRWKQEDLDQWLEERKAKV